MGAVGPGPPVRALCHRALARPRCRQGVSPVVVQVADDPDFTASVQTLFNNDRANALGLGVGTDREYFETYEGKLIDAKDVEGRYLRFYSKGSTQSALNEYTAIEVYGRRVP